MTAPTRAYAFGEEVTALPSETLARAGHVLRR